MTLDVVVPTYNRSALLCRAIHSLLRAPIPSGLEVRIVVADNNSPDDTVGVVRRLAENAPLPVIHVLATTQGSSAARNAGVAAGDSTLVGFIDDDEEIDSGWYLAVLEAFRDPSIDFIGGPCLPDRELRYPTWLPPGYHSVIGVTSIKQRGRYGPLHPGMLNGGNAVLRRELFTRIGTFAENLGRAPSRLLSEEDADLFRRLQDAGCVGHYVPELIILHHVHPERLTRNYHRRWAYWRGVSKGVLDRTQPEPVRYLLGLPRYKFGRACSGLLRLPLDRVRGREGKAFADELACWDLFGFAYGKYFFREENHYVKPPTNIQDPGNVV